VINNRIAYGDVKSKIRHASSLIESIELFDVYHGKGIEEGKKSLAVHLCLRSPDRTLSTQEADEAIQKISRVLEKKFNAIIRS
jgi:phenylalanyl-tRNA synthetase beta chain